MLDRFVSRPVLVATLCIGALIATPALAQRPAETGTGGGPGSTVTAPNTTTVGQTKPPGSAAAPDGPPASEKRTETEKRDDQVMKGICIGCGVK